MKKKILKQYLTLLKIDNKHDIINFFCGNYIFLKISTKELRFIIILNNGKIYFKNKRKVLLAELDLRQNYKTYINKQSDISLMIKNKKMSGISHWFRYFWSQYEISSVIYKWSFVITTFTSSTKSYIAYNKYTGYCK